MTEVLYHAYWNGEALRDVFEATAAIFSLGSFTKLAAFSVLFGLILVIAASAAKAEGKGTITFVASVVLLWFTLIVPKASVVITDVRSEEVYVVDNVPFGVAIPASVVNRAGFWLATTYETAFSPVEIARFTKFGAVFPERILEVLAATGPVDPAVREMAHVVLEACVIPEVATSEAKVREIMESTDIWGTLTREGWVNPARRVALGGDLGVISCPAALTTLQNVFESKELPLLKRVLGAKLAPETADPSALLARAVPEAEALLFGLSRSMDTSLRQSVLLAVVPEAAASFTAKADAPAALAVALSRAQGNLASEINYRTMASIAKDSLPKIRNALEFVVIALFPLVALLTLSSGTKCTLLLRGYFSLLLTVQLWPAVASVVNHLIVSADVTPFGALAREFGGNSLASLALIRETGATSQAIAGGLMCMVPVISYALVRAGDVAATTLVSGLMAPARSAASAQGANLAAGNLSQGNVRLSNTIVETHRGNKFDRSTEAVSSDSLQTKSAYGSVTRDGLGAVTGLTRTAVNFGLNESVSSSGSRRATNSVTTRRSNVKADSARYVIADAAVSADSSERGFASALRDAIASGRTFSTDQTSSLQSSKSQAVSEERGFSRTNQVSEGTDVTSAGGLSLISTDFSRASRNVPSIPISRLSASAQGTNLARGVFPEQQKQAREKGVSSLQDKQIGIAPTIDDSIRYGSRSNVVKLGSQVSLKEVQTLIDTATSSESTRSATEKREAYGELTRAAESVAKTSSDEGVRNAARRFLRSISATDLSSQESSRTVSSSVDAAGALSEDRAATTETTLDRNVFAMQNAIATFGSPEAALRAAYGSRFSQLAAISFASEREQSEENPHFGLRTLPSAKERVADVYETSAGAVSRASRENLGRLEKEIEAMPTPVEFGEMRRLENLPQLESQVLEQKGNSRIGREWQTAETSFERGLLLLSRESYRRDNADKNYALRNAFFFGLGYKSPEEISSELRARAAKDSKFAQVVSDIGSRSLRGLTEADWERLLDFSKPRR